MGTVPTGTMERELRKAYLQWLAGVSSKQPLDLPDYIDEFDKRSRAIISKYGGHAASLGALASFPVPKTLDLSPVANVVYDQMKQAAIAASITAGLNAKDVARQMLHAGLDKSYRRLERIARTETVSAYWKNSWDSVADLPMIVMVWSSEESKRTCDYCRSRDGLVVEDGNIRDHPNGRCTLIPTLRSRVEYKGTLQPDGSVVMDPRWAKKNVEENLDTLTSKELHAKMDAEFDKTRAMRERWPADRTIEELYQHPDYMAANAQRIKYRDAMNAALKAENAAKRALAAERKAAREANPNRFLKKTPKVDKLPRLDYKNNSLNDAVRRGDANPKNPSWQVKNGKPLTPAMKAALRDYEINCTRVAATTEMRMRGFDVKAMPAGAGADKSRGWTASNWYDPKTGKTREMTFSKGGADGLVNELSQFPEGARFLVAGPWKNGGAHIWNAEIYKGKVRFIEGQVYNGASQDVTQRYLASLDYGKYGGSSAAVQWLRVDDLMPTDWIVAAFEK